LIAAEEGVSIARRLAAANPAAQQQNLALALASLAARLWNSGQRERSLAVSEETLSLHWNLVKDNPRAHSRALGVVLNSYASHLLDVSRPHEALQAAKEAIETWRRLAAATQTDVTAQLERAIATRDRAKSALSGQEP
jgi:hypothetical protein